MEFLIKLRQKKQVPTINGGCRCIYVTKKRFFTESSGMKGRIEKESM